MARARPGRARASAWGPLTSPDRQSMSTQTQFEYKDLEPDEQTYAFFARGARRGRDDPQHGARSTPRPTGCCASSSRPTARSSRTRAPHRLPAPQLREARREHRLPGRHPVHRPDGLRGGDGEQPRPTRWRSRSSWASSSTSASNRHARDRRGAPAHRLPLLAIGTYGMDIGAFTPFLHCFREREKILDLFEWLCGARLLYNYNWVGGVSHDFPEGWTDRAKLFLDRVRAPSSRSSTTSEPQQDLHASAPRTSASSRRSSPSATRSPGRTCAARASSGTCARKIPTAATRSTSSTCPSAKGRYGPIGSCWDRYYVRVEEMRQSGPDHRPAGDRHAARRGRRAGAVPKRVKPAAGE